MPLVAVDREERARAADHPDAEKILQATAAAHPRAVAWRIFSPYRHSSVHSSQRLRAEFTPLVANRSAVPTTATLSTHNVHTSVCRRSTAYKQAIEVLTTPLLADEDEV